MYPDKRPPPNDTTWKSSRLSSRKVILDKWCREVKHTFWSVWSLKKKYILIFRQNKWFFYSVGVCGSSLSFRSLIIIFKIKRLENTLTQLNNYTNKIFFIFYFIGISEFFENLNIQATESERELNPQSSRFNTEALTSEPSLIQKRRKFPKQHPSGHFSFIW